VNVVLVVGNCSADHLFFDFDQRQQRRRFRGNARIPLAILRSQIEVFCSQEWIVVRQLDRSLDQVLQVPHIPRPRLGLQFLQQILVEILGIHFILAAILRERLCASAGMSSSRSRNGGMRRLSTFSR